MAVDGNSQAPKGDGQKAEPTTLPPVSHDAKGDPALNAGNKILFIAPHSDDELFGAGGTLLNLKGSGYQIKLVLVSASDINFAHHGTVPGSLRAEEFLRSAELLSTEPPELLGMPESKLDTQPVTLLVSKLDAILGDYRPHTVFIPEPSYHQDHQYVNRACVAALRPTKMTLPSRIFVYEIPSSIWSGSGPRFIPNTYVPLSEDTVERKVGILREVYKSQYSGEARCNLSEKGLREFMRYRGFEASVPDAEAFHLLREVIHL